MYEKFMLTKQKMNSFILEPKSMTVPLQSKNYVPRKTDTLFWIFYIIIHGFSEYELIGSNSFEVEKTEKYRLIELLRKKEYKDILKKNKITKIKEDLEDDLGHKERITHKTFFALCYAHKINVLFLHRQKCFQVHGGNPEDIYHVVRKYDPPDENPHGNFKYVYEVEATNEDREKYKKTFFQWECIDRPLKAISYYKVKDLTDICVLLKLTEDKYLKKNKQEIYEMLINIL